MRLFALISFVFIHLISTAQSYPEGFVKETAYSTFDTPAGMLHTDSSFAFVWELSGKVWMINEGNLFSQPIIDISEEVGFWGDHGMIGAALDPNFFENGYIYLLYAVDRHHLMNFGTPKYDADITETNSATIGRLTRYKINTVNFQFAIPDSRHILIGDQIETGFPISAPSHGVGSVLFGADGSLFASCGDGSTWVTTDDGHGFNGDGPVPTFGFDEQALADGILTQQEFLGSYRAQNIKGLNGKVIRINPETGQGLPNNPFYDADNPDAPQSKVWALGFRNPYRMVLKPGTGSDSAPGTIYVADVGDWVWEEINVISEPGKNYGWPMYQGPVVHELYYQVPTKNTSATNPLWPENSECSEFFDYQDLVLQPNESHSVVFPNPCNLSEIILDDQTTFLHERPALAYAHPSVDPVITAIPSFDENGDASLESVESSDVVNGESFNGRSGTGGTFLNHDSIPPEYKNWFVQADYTGWLRAFHFNEFDEIQTIDYWDDQIGAPIHVSSDPSDGSIYVVSINPSEIYKISFGGNRRPIAIATPDTIFGASPLSITLDASQSYDLDGVIQDYQWSLSNGEYYNGQVWNYEAIAPTNDAYPLEAKLVVTDDQGAKDSSIVHISLNNTPPLVDIISIEDNQWMTIHGPTTFDLKCIVADLEHSAAEMDYEWTVYLHHNTHFHRQEVFYGNDKSVVLIPPGCNDHEVYWYRIIVEVTDPGNLSASNEVEIRPDCLELVFDGSAVEEGYALFPNPVEKELTISANFKIGDNLEYEIYAADGRLITSEIEKGLTYRHSFKIDVSHLAPGGYVLKLNGPILNKKMRFIKITN